MAPTDDVERTEGGAGFEMALKMRTLAGTWRTPRYSELPKAMFAADRRLSAPRGDGGGEEAAAADDDGWRR